MGRYIVKVDRDQDLYLEWSTVVEAPTFIGGGPALLDHLTSDYRLGTARYEDELRQATVRKDRADETGCSAYPPFGLAWDDNDGLIYEQRGVLRRGSLAAFCDLLTAVDDPFDQCASDEQRAALMALLEPFEDGYKYTDRRVGTPERRSE